MRCYMSITSTVIELNQNNAIIKSPGTYQVQLSQPLVVNEGDNLSVRMVSIDSGKADGTTIIIPTDEQLTLGFSYYEIDYDANDKFIYDTSGTRTAATYDYYAAYNDVALITFNSAIMKIVAFVPPQNTGGGSADYTLPGGSFVIGTQGIGSTIDADHNFSITLSYLDEQANIKFFKCTGSYAVNDIVWYGGNNGWGCPTPTPELPAGTFHLIMPPGMAGTIMRKDSLRVAGVSGWWSGALNNDNQHYSTFPPYGSFPPGNAPDGTQTDLDYPYQPWQFDFYSINSTPYTVGGGLQLDINYLNVTLKAGKYDPQSLAVRLTQLIADAQGLLPPVEPPANPNMIYCPVNPLLTRTDAPRNAGMIFRQVDFSASTTDISFNQSNTYSYYNPITEITAPYFLGASEFALEFGNAGNVFSVTYAHTPMSNPGIAGEQDIAVYWKETNPGSGGSYYTYDIVKQASGVVFHSLSPVSFWRDQLGLYDQLVVQLQKDDKEIYYYTKDDMINKITYGFQGLSTFILPHTSSGTPPVYPDPRKMVPLNPTLNPTYLNVTGLSKAIIGDTLNENTLGGYYLVEILNALRNTSGYIDTKENRIRIGAIVSTQYDSNSTITGFQDSAIPYQHMGSSYLITDVVVRILDPFKNPVKDLGPNNCVWLQIDKPIMQNERIKPIVKRK